VFLAFAKIDHLKRVIEELILTQILEIVSSAFVVYEPKPPHVFFKLTGSETSRIIRAAKADLVVLDTLGYFSGSDENDSLAWKKNVMAPLRAYCAEFGCSFVINHHPRKSAADGTGNRWEQGRGTSAMFGDVDHYFTMSKVPLADHEKQLPEETRVRLEQRREFHVEKSKYSADGWSLQLEFWKPRGNFELGAW